VKQQNLIVQIDGEVVLEYDRRKPLNKRQKEDLFRIDAKLSQNVETDRQSLPQPNPLQFTEVVGCALVKALQIGNDQVTAAACAWLANRIPELRQVKAKTEDAGHVSIELVFNRGYQVEQTMRFVPQVH